VEVPFVSFKNRYAGGGCRVVGRGPTRFNYETLGQRSDPVFFINDAVCLEKRAAGETFFFAHDAQMLPWLRGAVRGTAVLPIEARPFHPSTGGAIQHPGPIVFYHWREHDNRELLLNNRDQIADLQILYSHSGTIHSLLHFLWFCGFTRAEFIGCDGLAAPAYDPRLENRSHSAPDKQYQSIRTVQDHLARIFGIQVVYLGTPGGVINLATEDTEKDGEIPDCRLEN
jgi:hypothetical protein